MKKKIICLVIICILLSMGLTSVSANNISIQQIHTTDKSLSEIYYSDDRKSFSIEFAGIPTEKTGNGPDLNLTKFWVWYSEENLFIEYEVTNIGDTYYDPNGEPIEYYLELFVDDSTIPFHSKKLPSINIGDPSVLSAGCISGSGVWFFEINDKPNKVRAIVDITNSITESDEDNEYTTIVYQGVIVYGAVNKKSLLGQTPYEGVYVMPRMRQARFTLWNITDENGNYKFSLYPKSEDQEHAYDIGVYRSFEELLIDKSIKLSASDLVKAGESTELNFSIRTKSKSSSLLLNSFIAIVLDQKSNMVPLLRQLLRI